MAKKRIITDIEITEAWKKGIRSIEIDNNTIITPQAQDSAKVKNIIFVKNPVVSRVTNNKINKFIITIGSDHSGFKIKEVLKRYLLDTGHQVKDIGTFTEEPCDYPDISYKVAISVKEMQADFGIIIDGTGVASSIVANKIPGIRAACCTNETMAKISREHNDANILTLGSKILGEELIKNICTTFINTSFSEGRHLNRIEKIRDIEKKYLKS